MQAQVWFGAGIVLLACEVFIPTGFYLLMLGVAALVVGAVTLLGLVSAWIPQAAIFCPVALVLWFAGAEKLQRALSSKEQVDGGVVGHLVVAQEMIAPGARGRGELWGTSWTLENVGPSTIAANLPCVVQESDGIVLKVKGKG